MDANDAYHAQTGRPMLRSGAGEPHLADDSVLWVEVWDRARVELLSDWIRLHPGSRPPAWWAFDCDERPMEGESEVDCLHRLGELGADEIEAIRRKALGLAEYNSCGRRPERPNDNFIPPDALSCFAARIGLLSEAERAVLRLDERGEYLHRGRVPKFEA